MGLQKPAIYINDTQQIIFEEMLLGFRTQIEKRGPITKTSLIFCLSVSQLPVCISAAAVTTNTKKVNNININGGALISVCDIFVRFCSI